MRHATPPVSRVLWAQTSSSWQSPLCLWVLPFLIKTNPGYTLTQAWSVLMNTQGGRVRLASGTEIFSSSSQPLGSRWPLRLQTGFRCAGRWTPSSLAWLSEPRGRRWSLLVTAEKAPGTDSDSLIGIMNIHETMAVAHAFDQDWGRCWPLLMGGWVGCVGQPAHAPARLITVLLWIEFGHPTLATPWGRDSLYTAASSHKVLLGN